jgi:hypothetical protein
VKIIREEEIGSEEDYSFWMTTPESSNFEDAWNFNHQHLSMKDHQENVCRGDVYCERRISSFPKGGAGRL